MSVPVLPLPGLPSAFLAVLLYATTGLGYLAVTGTELPDWMRPDSDHGSSVTRVSGMLLVLAAVVVLWPAAPLVRAARSRAVRSLTTTWSSWAEANRPRGRRFSEPRAHPEATEVAGTGPEDFSGEEAGLAFAVAAARIRVACEQRRLIDAVFMASALVDDVTRRCGPDHPQVLDAMELLAHVAHLVGDEARSVRLYVHVASRRAWHYGVDYPGAKTALRNAYASWLATSDQAALVTGFLLLPCLRLVAGSAAPITRSSEYRLRSLRAALGSGSDGA